MRRSFSSRTARIDALALPIPGTLRSACAAWRRRSAFSCKGTAKGSRAQGETQVPVTLGVAASSVGAAEDRRAPRHACSASFARRVAVFLSTVGEAAKPQAPSTRTRRPRPYSSLAPTPAM
ncbi:MAG: hypothetical protein R3B09_28720 [Nannocystaceae bacterium]